MSPTLLRFLPLYDKDSCVTCLRNRVLQCVSVCLWNIASLVSLTSVHYCYKCNFWICWLQKQNIHGLWPLPKQFFETRNFLTSLFFLIPLLLFNFVAVPLFKDHLGLLSPKNNFSHLIQKRKYLVTIFGVILEFVVIPFMCNCGSKWKVLNSEK